MGQKVHPTGARVGIIKDWNSKWYADSKNFADYLVEDQKIRKFLKKKLYAAGISKTEIERTAKMVKINLYAAKPGIVIGKGGAGNDSYKNDSQNNKPYWFYNSKNIGSIGSTAKKRGTAKTTAQLQTRSTYNNWVDFDSYWIMTEGSYPTLKWLSE